MGPCDAGAVNVRGFAIHWRKSNWVAQESVGWTYTVKCHKQKTIRAVHPARFAKNLAGAKIVPGPWWAEVLWRHILMRIIAPCNRRPHWLQIVTKNNVAQCLTSSNNTVAADKTWTRDVWIRSLYTMASYGLCRGDTRFAHSQWETVLQILGLHPANERRRYIVTVSLIGWAQA